MEVDGVSKDIADDTIYTITGAGSHTIVVKDKAGRESTIDFTITYPTATITVPSGTGIV
ncbi:MAG: hypothetical protein LBU27_04085 [Candidatus Peribacteria bacterium]|nr:hypothetical protein [Candidatus Peribacteria bacterium]